MKNPTLIKIKKTVLIERVVEISEIAKKYGFAIDWKIAKMLARNAVVALGVSGGKDSVAMTLKMWRFLQEIEFLGEVVLIHSDLGHIEHADSLPTCHRLSEKTGFPLVVVKPRIDMIGRFYQRNGDNANRYVNLLCVKMITPWSSSKLRFCTSEMKIAPITAKLKKMFPGRAIINAVGIRGEESDARKRKPVSKVNKRLYTKSNRTRGRDWNPILNYLIEHVWLAHRGECFAAHEAYDKNGNSRVSCCACVLATVEDIRASMKDERNHESYRLLVRLEVVSSYSFSQSFWLGDACPELLDAETLIELLAAKQRAMARIQIEAEIPDILLYVKGWPTFQPSLEQCELIASVRRRIGQLYGLPVKYTTAIEVYDRYAELLLLKEQKKQK